MNIDEQKTADFLENKNLRVEKFPKKARYQLKTPDFRVLKKDKLVFFCEVKTVSRDEWLNQQLEMAPPGTIVGGGRSDPVFNRLSTKIHEATQQFNAVNPNLEYPNVLVFVNHDKMCGFLDLVAVITGYALTEGNGRLPIYPKFSKGRIVKEKLRIHLYIWKDEFKGLYYLFNTFSKEYFDNLCNYFNIDSKSVKNI